jgi:hypothetical protein
MDGSLLETAEGLGHGPIVYTGHEILDWLQSEKEKVAREILMIPHGRGLRS